MAVVDPRNQLPEDPQVPSHDDPLTESWHDPLSEFAPEPPPRRERLLQFAWEPPPPNERLIEFEPDWRGPGESNRLTERALPATASSLSFGSPRASNGRWFIGAIMLGVGLVAGFAGGIAVVNQFGGEQNESVRSALALDRVDSAPPPTAVQTAPSQPLAQQPVDNPSAPIPAATNDPTPPAEANAAMPAPKPPVTAPRVATVPLASREPVETTASRVTALYVQSNPAGAEVYLDDKLVSTTPFQLSDIVPGQYTIRIEMQGYRTWSAPVNVEPGARATISAILGR